MTIKLEVGKSYRNRLGEKITIIDCDDHHTYPFNDTEGLSYTKKGLRFEYRENDNSDLIAEWEECCEENSCLNEEKPKYKAGDLVTIRLDDMDAANLNSKQKQATWNKVQIVKHEPAPEPFSVFMYFDENRASERYYHRHSFDIGERVGTLVKISFDPSTQQVTATVVSDE